MKTWRVLLLMLLALLLPVRGAMAAAMLCPPGGHGHVVVQMPPAQHAHGGQHQEHAHMHHMAAPAGEAGPHAGDPPAGDPPADDTHGSCHVCAGVCSMTPLPSAIPTLLKALPVSSMRYPDWAAPAPLFLSDGQERPPRSI